MSNHLAIATATASLARILAPAASVVPNGTVKLDRPDTPQNGTSPPVVNIYLYQISPNVSLRNADLPIRGSNGDAVQRSRTAWNLYYLLTFLGNESDLEPQRLAGAVLRQLNSHAVLTGKDINDVRLAAGQEEPEHGYLLTTNLDEQVELVKFAPLSLNLEELSKLWSVFFQTPYSLSVAYSASVVLIDGEETPKAPLPVRKRLLRTLTFRSPHIEDLESDRIGAGGTLTVRGRNLAGELTRLRVGDELIPPTTVTGRRITAALPATLPAGVQAVQVVHELNLGDPPKPHPGFESNVTPFVLTPAITTAAPIEVARGAMLTLDVSPAVGRAQRVAVLIGDQEIARLVDPEDPKTIASPRFQIPLDFDTGEHLVRVRVDGAESPLTVDEDQNSDTFNDYVGPVLTITEPPEPPSP